MAAEIMLDTANAHHVLVKEELGINPGELEGSAMEAAIYSFVLFSVGAIIPVAPFLFTKGTPAILMSVAFSAVGLFLIGAAITLFTGRSVWFSGFRQVSAEEGWSPSFASRSFLVAASRVPGVISR